MRSQFRLQWPISIHQIRCSIILKQKSTTVRRNTQAISVLPNDRSQTSCRKARKQRSHQIPSSILTNYGPNLRGITWSKNEMMTKCAINGCCHGVPLRDFALMWLAAWKRKHRRLVDNFSPHLRQPRWARSEFYKRRRRSTITFFFPISLPRISYWRDRNKFAIKYIRIDGPAHICFAKVRGNEYFNEW